MCQVLAGGILGGPSKVSKSDMADLVIILRKNTESQTQQQV